MGFLTLSSCQNMIVFNAPLAWKTKNTLFFWRTGSSLASSNSPTWSPHNHCQPFKYAIHLVFQQINAILNIKLLSSYNQFLFTPPTKLSLSPPPFIYPIGSVKEHHQLLWENMPRSGLLVVALLLLFSLVSSARREPGYAANLVQQEVESEVGSNCLIYFCWLRFPI